MSQDGTEYKYSYDDEHNMTKIAYGNGATKTMEYDKFAIRLYLKTLIAQQLNMTTLVITEFVK